MHTSKWIVPLLPAVLLSFLLFHLGCGGGKGDINNIQYDPYRNTVLGPAVQYTSGGVCLAKTVIADMNGDWRKDIVSIQRVNDGQKIFIYYQNEEKTFDAPFIITVDLRLRGVAAGDVNGDGRVDLVVSGISTTTLAGFLGQIRVLYQDPISGALSPPVAHSTTTNNVGDLAIADLNSDGRNDIVVLGAWESKPQLGNLSIFFQNPDGTLGSEVLYDKVFVNFTGEIHVADMDGDGDNDIIFQSLGNLVVARQILPGIFSDIPDIYPLPTNLTSFDIGDVNGDGRKDVVVMDSSSNDDRLVFFYQDIQGALGPPVVVPIPGGGTFGIEITDIDGDGLNDIWQ